MMKLGMIRACARRSASAKPGLFDKRRLPANIVAGLASLALGACSAASPEVRAAMQAQVGDHAQQAEQALRRGDMDQARSGFQNAVRDLEAMADEEYLANNLYFERAEAASGVAWVDVLSGQVERGSAGLNATIDELASDERAHIAYLRDLDRQRQTALALLGAVLVVGAAVADAHAAPGTGTPALDDITRPNGALESIVHAIETMDSTSLAERFVGADSTNTDGVRMLVLPARNYPLNLVGQVVTSDGLCTGSLIGERMVLTAAHCVTDAQGDKLPARSVGFVLESPGYRHQSLGKQIYLAAAPWDGNHENDWAVVELVNHPPAFGHLQLSQAPAGQDEIDELVRGLMLPGFSSDLNDGRFMSLDYGCSPISLESEGQLLHHLCATWSGASGGPVLVAGTARVVGIHIGGYHGTDVRVMRAIDASLLSTLRAIIGEDDEKPSDPLQLSEAIGFPAEPLD